MKRIRKSEIRVVDADGIVHIGTGDGQGQAVRDLGERHTEETRYTLTTEGAYVAAGLACARYLDDPTTEAAGIMSARYSLAERLALLDEWGGA